MPLFGRGPHHRSPRPETISDSGPIRVGTLSTADRCAGGTKWQLLPAFPAWFKTDVVRVTVRTDGEPERARRERVAQNGSKWLTLGRSLEPFRSARRRPGTGVFGMGGAKVARAQTTSIPSLVSVDSACLQPFSGQRSRVSDRPLDRGSHASNVR
jgi:hypothetical protein